MYFKTNDKIFLLYLEQKTMTKCPPTPHSEELLNLTAAKLKILSFSFIRCDKIYEIKFITSLTTSKMLPTTLLLQLQPFLLFKICTKFY